MHLPLPAMQQYQDHMDVQFFSEGNPTLQQQKEKKIEKLGMRTTLIFQKSVTGTAVLLWIDFTTKTNEQYKLYTIS